MNQLESVFVEYIANRQQRITSHIQSIFNSNGVDIDLSLFKLNSGELGEVRIALEKHGVKIFQEILTNTLPFTETWKIVCNGSVIGHFEADTYGVITDL